MEPGFTYKVDNQELIDLLRNEFYSNPNSFWENRGKQNYEKYLGTTKENDNKNFGWLYWDNHIELYNYLNEVTYPREPGYFINQSWMKYYPEGSFSGLHQEASDYQYSTSNQYTNVILIDQAEDIIGGMVVIAGDSHDIDTKNPNSKGNLKERLYTRFLKVPGEGIVWDERAVHGVSRIEKGYRLVFVCTKIKMER
jgi:hypothetical protein